MRLEAENIGYRYRTGQWILRDVNVGWESGEVLGLTGPSGCGKTTLARVLAGYHRPRRGRVRLNGAPLPREGYHPVQLVFQHPEKAINARWHLSSTVKEGYRPDAKQLACLGIEREWLRRWPHELSGGELQRFCIARALGPDTRFLIADEMTTMLDAITQVQICQELLAIVRQRNLGLMLVSHESSLLRRLCDRVIELPAQTGGNKSFNW